MKLLRIVVVFFRQCTYNQCKRLLICKRCNIDSISDAITVIYGRHCNAWLARERKFSLRSGSGEPWRLYLKWSMSVSLRGFRWPNGRAFFFTMRVHPLGGRRRWMGIYGEHFASLSRELFAMMIRFYSHLDFFRQCRRHFHLEYVSSNSCDEVENSDICLVRLRRTVAICAHDEKKSCENGPTSRVTSKKVNSQSQNSQSDAEFEAFIENVPFST